MALPPENPVIYHIVHIDRLQSILNSGYLWSDKIVSQHQYYGTIIGMQKIKNNRLNRTIDGIYSDLHVGECVPFYFCPRSVMLYMIYKKNHYELEYAGGQESIVHLRADLYTTVEWAEKNNLRWAFSSSNASSAYASFSSNLSQINHLNWDAINACYWAERSIKDQKQAEFLIENKFNCNLIDYIGVHNQDILKQAKILLNEASYCNIEVNIRRDWYY